MTPVRLEWKTIRRAKNASGMIHVVVWDRSSKRNEATVYREIAQNRRVLFLSRSVHWRAPRRKPTPIIELVGREWRFKIDM